MDPPTHTAPDVAPAHPRGLPRGYGWWRIDDEGWLQTLPGIRWTPGWNEASCSLYPRFLRGRWRRLHPTGVPGAFCLCGFHGSYRPQPAGPGPRLAARIHSGADGMLFGVVEGAGTMAGDGRGWRARFARPLAVYVPPERFAQDRERIGAVAARYGIPILRNFDALVAGWGPTAAEEPSVRSA